MVYSIDPMELSEIFINTTERDRLRRLYDSESAEFGDVYGCRQIETNKLVLESIKDCDNTIVLQGDRPSISSVLSESSSFACGAASVLEEEVSNGDVDNRL
jgi:hypothetical protein